MSISKSFRAFPPVAAITLIAALSFPCATQAINIGEIVSQSRLKEPLHVQIELMAEAGETIEDACLSIVLPEPHGEGLYNYLAKARVAVKTEGGRKYAVISASEPLNEPLARISLQIGCHAKGAATRTLTFVLGSNVAPVMPAGIGAVSGKSSGKSSGKLNANREGEPSGGKTEGGLELSLSAKQLDESRIGEISPEERDLWRLKQKLFYVDDQMNNLLIIQNQLKQMRAELVKLAPRVAEPGPGGHVATGVAAGRQAGSPANPAATVIHVADTMDAKSGAMMWQRVVVGAGLALFAALALFFGLRRYRRIKLQHGVKVWDSPNLATSPQVSPAVPVIKQSQSIVRPGEVTNAKHSPPPTAYTKDTDKLAEVNSMIEEAELYAIHGRPNKAIEMLSDIILEYPEKVEAWLLLLSIFGNEKNVRQFESIARKFLSNMGGNDAWKGICGVGRSIDPNNPLYFDADSTHETNAEQSIKLNKRRLLGDILVDMNAISMSDLESSVAHFDYLRDGRFGNYLVARGLIKQDQLDEALQQQSKEAATNPPPSQINSDTHVPRIQAEKPRPIGDVLVQMGMVTEQELEHALANFDPEHHGHCGTYLVECELITEGQLYKALLHQLGGSMTAGLDTPAEEPPAEDSTKNSSSEDSAKDSSAKNVDEIPWDVPDRWIR